MWRPLSDAIEAILESQIPFLVAVTIRDDCIEETILNETSQKKPNPSPNPDPNHNPNPNHNLNLHPKRNPYLDQTGQKVRAEEVALFCLTFSRHRSIAP